jgi:hypothetical protein
MNLFAWLFHFTIVGEVECEYNMHVVLNFLRGKSGTNGGFPHADKWLSYFDIIVMGRSIYMSSFHFYLCNKIHVILDIR